MIDYTKQYELPGAVRERQLPRDGVPLFSGLMGKGEGRKLEKTFGKK